MKILAVTNDKNFIGGANKSFYIVLEGLKKDYKVSIDVLTSGRGKFEEQVKKIGIKCYIYPFRGVVSGYKKDGKDLLRILKVKLLYYYEYLLGIILSFKFKNSNYDIIYTNMRLSMVGAIIAKRLNIPHVCHIREFYPDKPILGKWTYKDIYKNSAKIICISKSIYNEISKYVPTDKLELIYDAIEEELSYHEIFKNDKINMILAGRIVPDKGHEDILYALIKLKEKEYDNIILNIAGDILDKEYYNKLQKIIKDNNLTDNVIVHGKINDMKIIRKNMDIELMCSIKEPLGRVTVEGMRNSLLVIGSNTGGTIEIIEDKITGLLYKQGDYIDLASKIEYAILNKKKSCKIAFNGYNYSKNHFTRNENIKLVYELFNDIIRKV